MPVSSRVINGVATITVEGRFDFNIHSEFKAASTAVFAHKDVKAIDISLAQVDYLDSSALGTLLVLRDQANEARITTLALVGARDMVRQILDIAHFEKFFTLR